MINSHILEREKQTAGIIIVIYTLIGVLHSFEMHFLSIIIWLMCVMIFVLCWSNVVYARMVDDTMKALEDIGNMIRRTKRRMRRLK